MPMVCARSLIIFFRCPMLVIRAEKPRYPFGPEGKERGDHTLTRSLNDRRFRDPSPSARTGVATPVRAIHHDPNGRQSHKTSDVRGVLPDRVDEILLGDDGVSGQDLGPPLEART